MAEVSIRLHVEGDLPTDGSIVGHVSDDATRDALKALGYGWLPLLDDDEQARLHADGWRRTWPWIREILDRQTEWLESMLRQLTLGESLCVHEHGGETRRTMTAHALAPGARCHVSTPSRKTQHGPMTAEILAALETRAE
jgi:hypothetical protein